MPESTSRSSSRCRSVSRGVGAVRRPSGGGSPPGDGYLPYHPRPRGARQIRGQRRRPRQTSSSHRSRRSAARITCAASTPMSSTTSWSTNSATPRRRPIAGWACAGTWFGTIARHSRRSDHVYLYLTPLPSDQWACALTIRPTTRTLFPRGDFRLDGPRTGVLWGRNRLSRGQRPAT
jgi:hypothetical protein